MSGQAKVQVKKRPGVVRLHGFHYTPTRGEHRWATGEPVEVVPLSVAEALADAIEAAGHGPHEDEECPACLALAAYRANHPKPSVAELVEHSRELGEGMRVAGDTAVGHLRAAADELREKGTP